MKTEKNSKMMKTQVEVFVIEETQELIYDSERLQEWGDLVGQLGLKGQRSLAVPEKSPVPYMHMKKSLENMFTVLCPVKVDITEYNVTPIPVEILRLASLSLKEKHFNKVEIWYDDVKPDPVCVGIKGVWGEGSYQDNRNRSLSGKEFETKDECVEAGAVHPTYRETNKYLVGRWADENRSFEELRGIARERMLEEKTKGLMDKKRKIQRELDDVEGKVDEYLRGESTYFETYF